MVQNLIVIASFVGFMLAMCLYEPAFEYLEHFLDQQLFSALAGKREGGEDPMNRLYIFQQIIMQNAPIVALSLIVWLIGRHKVKAPVSKWVVFFALLGIIGSVPIAISPKQHEIYLIPAATCFALAAAWFVFPYVKYWTESVRFSPSLFRNLRLFMWLLIAGVLVYTTTEIKKPGREIEVLADMPQLAKHVPEGATIGACTTMMADFVVHGYLQRYHHWGLTPDPKVPIYFLTQEDCGHEFEQELLARGFNLVPLTTQRFKLWKK